MQKIPVKIKLLHPDAKTPVYSTEESAGFDIYSVEEKIIEPGATVVVNSGIALEVEEGYCVQFWDRGGMGVKGIHHFAGLVDSDYRGEFKIVLHNSTGKAYKIEKGDRIIQAVILPVMKAEFNAVENLGETKRGEGRFHSTGK